MSISGPLAVNMPRQDMALVLERLIKQRGWE